MGADSGGERERTGDLAELAEVREGYGRWLGRQPLSANTKKAYAARAGRYLDWLAGTPTAEYGNPLGETHARDYAARDFKSHLKTVGKAKPSSVNLSLAAIDNLYRYLGLGRPDVRREELPKAAPRALSPGDQRRFLRAVERCASALNSGGYGGLVLGTWTPFWGTIVPKSQGVHRTNSTPTWSHPYPLPLRAASWSENDATCGGFRPPQWS